MDSHLEHIRICMGEPDSTPHITINADIHPEEAKEAMRQWMEDDRITIKENKRSSDLKSYYRALARNVKLR